MILENRVSPDVALLKDYVTPELNYKYNNYIKKKQVVPLLSVSCQIIGIIQGLGERMVSASATRLYE